MLAMENVVPWALPTIIGGALGGLYAGEDPSNVINALIAAAIAFVATFVILWFIGFEDVKPDQA